MPIQFEEISAQIDTSSQSQAPSPTAAASPPSEDFEGQLDRALRLRAERAERVSAE
ncbi:MAG: hypothetical protein JWO58_3302 [Chitinophagaceae bacterium]|nr:hypothetical protein [Chitinophagaceae bacterium]MDB5813787.1 hypothetical protein [Rhodocyclales bacterium]